MSFLPFLKEMTIICLVSNNEIKKLWKHEFFQRSCSKTITIKTTEGGGLAVKSVVPSGLGSGGPRFESRNGKRLGLNPTIPTLDQLVPSWGWDNSYGSPVPSEPSE